MIRVLIADDHPLVRDALARIVRQLDADAEVLLADDYASMQRLAGFSPDLALVDLNMPGMQGTWGVRELRRAQPSMALVVASGQEDARTIRAVLDAGANGFIPKTEPPDLLLNAVRLVMAGGIYMPPKVLEAYRQPDPEPPAPEAPPDVASLTRRQRDVLRLLLNGQPNKVIARELGLTEGTVKIHIAAILRVLRARNRTEAVVRARSLGLDEPTRHSA